MIARVFGKLSAPALLLAFGLVPARADIFTFNNQPYAFFANVCGETDAGGCTATFTVTMADETSVSVTIASDGEQSFDPFGFGFDISDGIQFSGLGSTSVSSTGLGWTNLNSAGAPVANTWVLPANLSSIDCGTENEPSCEPMGDFIFSQPFMDTFPNSPNGGLWMTISDPSGDPSDWVFLANTAAGGNGEALFFSDPNAPVPEPGVMLLVGSGLIAAWYFGRKRKSS